MSTASGALVMVNCQEVSSRSEPRRSRPYPIMEEGILLILCPTIAMARKRILSLVWMSWLWRRADEADWLQDAPSQQSE